MRWLGVLLALTLVPITRADLRPLFDSIREVESGGDATKVGDGGRSIGPYQIQWRYWKDSGVPGRYEQVRNPRYAERVMLAYWQRYCPESLARQDYQTLARVHNGGATGARKTATLPYWRKVLRELRERDAVSPSVYKPVRGRSR